MGLWDAIKKAAVTAKCATGWHAGTYTPVSGEPKCHLEKTCPDCGKHLTTTKHNYTDWRYISSGKCDMERTCTYCNKKEFKVKHDYRVIGKDKECHVIESCTRCKAEKTGFLVRHDYEEIGHEDIFSCRVIEKCRDCGYQRIGAERHDWVTDSGRTYCLRCKKNKA